MVNEPDNWSPRNDYNRPPSGVSVVWDVVLFAVGSVASTWGCLVGFGVVAPPGYREIAGTALIALGLTFFQSLTSRG